MSAATKYASLLQPLRDLADNWSVDIARDLEDYLEQLEGITFTFEDGGKALNFAEAALLIQGSALVYGKKVEFLYNLAFQALEFITARRRAKQAEDGGGGGDDAQKGGDDDFVDADAAFNSLDDAIPAAANIDLDEEKEQEKAMDARRRPLLCCFSAVLPPVSSTSVNASASAAAGASGGGGELQMSACLVHRNGALVLETASTAAADDVWFSAAPPPLQRPLQEVALMPGSPVDLAVGAAEDDDDDAAGDFGVGDDGIVLPDKPAELPPLPDPSAFASDNYSGGGDDAAAVGAGMEEEPAPMGEAASQTPPQTVEARRHMMELRQRRMSRRATVAQRDGGDVVVEEWVLLDPHDASAAALRPFRRGKTFRIPPGLSHRKQRHAAKPSPENVADDDGVAAVRVRAPFFEEFDELYEAEMKRRRAALLAKRRPNVAAASPANAPIVCDADEGMRAEEALFEQPYAVVAEDALGFGGDEDDDGDDGGGASAGVILPGDESAIPAASTFDEDDGYDDSVAAAAAVAVAPFTVEDTLADTMAEEEARLEQLQAASRRLEERRRQELGLAARIAEWHSRLEPVIEAQEARQGFDIQECAQELLDTVERHHAARVGFAELVKGKEQWEISRYFLSTLLLMNCGNVEVASKAPRLMLKVNTTEPRFDACNAFEAAQKAPLPVPPPPSAAKVNSGDEEEEESGGEKQRKKRKRPKQKS